jgi:hypothetical protein
MNTLNQRSYFLFLFLLTLTTSGFSQAKKSDIVKKKLKGNIISLTEFHYAASGPIGKIIKEDMLEEIIYKYNDIGVQLEEEQYLEDRKLAKKTVYIYDKKGNRIQENWYGFDGTLNSKITYEYDKKGNAIEERKYLYGRLSLVNVNEFAKGKKVEESRYIDESLKSRHIYKYDKKGNMIEESVFVDNALSCKNIIKYDKNGNEIEFNNCLGDGSLKMKYTRTYETFDKEGNWLKQISFENEKAVSITEREFVYVY